MLAVLLPGGAGELWFRPLGLVCWGCVFPLLVCVGYGYVGLWASALCGGATYRRRPPGVIDGGAKTANSTSTNKGISTFPPSTFRPTIALVRTLRRTSSPRRACLLRPERSPRVRTFPYTDRFSARSSNGVPTWASGNRSRRRQLRWTPWVVLSKHAVVNVSSSLQNMAIVQQRLVSRLVLVLVLP
jgi:hypothetical protein